MDQFEKLKKKDVLKEMEKARKTIAAHPAADNIQTREAYAEMCSGDAILIVKNLSAGEEEWLTGPLAKDFIRHAEVLLALDDWDSDTAEHLQTIYNALTYLTDYVSDRPRLLARLYRMNVEAIERLGKVVDEDGSALEEAKDDVEWIEANIKAADEGRYDDIVSRGILKSDPLEWTKEWEDVIDEVDKQAYKEMKGMPRGMGFCFGFWTARRAALEERGLSWRDPHQMNPGVLFD